MGIDAHVPGRTGGVSPSVACRGGPEIPAFVGLVLDGYDGLERLRISLALTSPASTIEESRVSGESRIL